MLHVNTSDSHSRSISRFPKIKCYEKHTQAVVRKLPTMPLAVPPLSVPAHHNEIVCGSASGISLTLNSIRFHTQDNPHRQSSGSNRNPHCPQQHTAVEPRAKQLSVSSLDSAPSSLLLPTSSLLLTI